MRARGGTLVSSEWIWHGAGPPYRLDTAPAVPFADGSKSTTAVPVAPDPQPYD
jgi:hypothetical protein